LRDIEKLVRMKLADRPLPEGFMAAVEAIKRLKPAPRRDDTRERQPHSGRRFTPTAEIKADRRSDHRKRNNRNEGQQRHPQRADSHAEPRNEGVQRRDERHGQQRHPHRADGHAAHRPEGGKGKRPFRGRRRFGGHGRAGGRAQA
jgi:ATP-dependent RNA helicase RhlE